MKYVFSQGPLLLQKYDERFLKKIPKIFKVNLVA